MNLPPFSWRRFARSQMARAAQQERERRRPTRRRSAALHVETLEDRTLLTVTSVYGGGLLSVVSDANDPILITMGNDGNTKILGITESALQSTAQVANVSGAGGVAVSGTVSLNQIGDTLDRHIGQGSTVNVAGTLTAVAADNSIIESLAGAIQAAGGTTWGAAVAHNAIGNSLASYVDHSSVSVAQGGSNLSAGSTATIRSLSAGFSISGDGSVAGALSLSEIHNSLTAHVSGNSTVSANTDIQISATNSSDIHSLAGQAVASAGAAI